MAAAMSSALNPNAAPFIPAAMRQVEDFSPEWWELVKTTAWFRDHWFHQHQMFEESASASAAAFAGEHDDDLAALLPDDELDLLDTDDLFYTPEPIHQKTSPSPVFDADVLRSLSLNSPMGGFAGGVRDQRQQQLMLTPRPHHHHGEKPAQFVGGKVAGRRVIHQPR
uniref:Ataxin-2 C-terminal domain-containing protein n=1 Tax=Leersia perrieri TaxID=77586 RepID=A0A0D9X2I3_9ORYZ